MKSIHISIGTGTLMWVASSCSQFGGAQPAPPQSQLVVDTVFVVDTISTETESAEVPLLQNQVARLQIQLLERDIQLREMQTQLDVTRQEVVRNLAKLQSQASRAEAASGMAEAEIALQSLARASGGSDLTEFARARARLAESSAEFGSENYGGALYLATQARSLARSGQERLRAIGAESLATGESLFAIPVPLETNQRSNVRAGPGTDFDVRFTLEAAAHVVGHSYTSQWVRIVDDEGREGWVFHTLLVGGGL